MILALPVHNISNVCYVKEAENSHVIAIQTGIIIINIKIKILDFLN